ncbi:UPF0187 protein [Galdieria sulphuraria]|nr:UPF0187 protein [Galdieria sulphuraria]
MLLKLFLVAFLQHVQGTADVVSFRKMIRSNPEYSDSSSHFVDIFADEIVHSPNPPLFVLFQLSMQIKAAFRETTNVSDWVVNVLSRLPFHLDIQDTPVDFFHCGVLLFRCLLYPISSF